MSKLREYIDAVEAERDELQRQVEAARTALKEIALFDEHPFVSDYVRHQEMERIARHALAPQPAPTDGAG